MYVYQCPECDLKSQFASELQQHLALDHPNFVATPQTIEAALSSTNPPPAPSADSFGRTLNR
jgi:hypothetical protein